MLPQFVRMEMMPSGTLRYVSTNPITGQTKALLSDDVIHLKDMSMDGYAGLYTIRHHRTAIGLGLALENFGLYYFLNGSRPGGVLEMVGKMTPEAQERIRTSWHAMYTGPRNTNRVAILEEGMKFNPIAINNDNAQYIDSRKLQADEIARLFRVPPHVIGILEKATFSNIEHQSLDYVKSCLRPWFVRWEEELNCKLFPGYEYTFEHDEDGLLRGDFSTRMTGYAAGRQWGWLSANDVRRHENMNSIGPEGDVYLSPLNMIPADQADQVLAGKGAVALALSDPPDPAGKLSEEGDQVAVSPAARAIEAQMTSDRVRDYVLPLFEDCVGRSLNYDRNSQLQKSVSRAFTRPLGILAKMLGHRADADVVARKYADDLYLRREEWDSMTTPQIIEREFDLACEALKVEKRNDLCECDCPECEAGDCKECSNSDCDDPNCEGELK
jgi:HK97 family phage portal protein